MTPFLYRVDMSKLSYSFSVGFNGTFYGDFVKGPIRSNTIHSAAKFLLILYFLEAVPITDQLNRF